MYRQVHSAVGIGCLGVVVIILAGCTNHAERAQNLLAKAEVECGMRPGYLGYLETSNDPKAQDRRVGRPLPIEEIYVEGRDLSAEAENCINQVFRREGYRIRRVKTH